MRPGGTLFWHTSSSFPPPRTSSQVCSRQHRCRPFGCSVNGKWRAAVAWGLPRTSGARKKKKTLCSHVVIHATVTSKHLWPRRKPWETFSLVLFWLYMQHEVTFIFNFVFFFHINYLKCRFICRTRKRKNIFQSKWIYGAISILIITVSLQHQVGFTRTNISYFFFLPANE